MASLVATAVGLSSPAAAEMSAQEFMQQVDRGEQVPQVYMAGIATGIEWANASASKKLYCAPQKLAITADQNLSMLREVLRETPRLATSPLGLVLMISYERTFPCPG